MNRQKLAKLKQRVAFAKAAIERYRDTLRDGGEPDPLGAQALYHELAMAERSLSRAECQ